MSRDVLQGAGAELDWSWVLSRLLFRSRLPLSALARRARVDRDVLYRLRDGEAREPKFSVGRRLEGLCEDYFHDDDWAVVRSRFEGALRSGGTERRADIQQETKRIAA